MNKYKSYSCLILLVILFNFSSEMTLLGQSAITILDTSHVILNDNSNNYFYTGPNANSASPYNQTGVNYQVRFNRGGTQNLKLNGFTHGSNSYYVNLVKPYFVKLNRVDSTMNIGQRELLFYQRHDYNSSNHRLDLAPAFIGDMEATLSSTIINKGTDNVFGNVPSQNINNIERIDVIFPNGITTSHINDVGFLILERGGNDPFAIAAITSLNTDSTPSSYKRLLHVATTAWGNSGISPAWVIMRKESNDTVYRIIENIGAQSISGVFLNFTDLGLLSNETVYGYSLFGSDIDTNIHVLTNPATFPRNTSNATGAAGGLDILSIPGIFHPDYILLENDVFKAFELEKKNSNVTLTWSTFSPDFDGLYTIEKSNDMENIQELDHIKANGNHSFHYNHTTYQKEKAYYRIKRTDPANKTSYTQWRFKAPELKDPFTISPQINPVSDNIHVKVTGYIGEKVTLLLVDSYGRNMQQIEMRLDDESGYVSFYLDGYKPGSYHVVAKKQNGESRSFIVIKH